MLPKLLPVMKAVCDPAVFAVPVVELTLTDVTNEIAYNENVNNIEYTPKN